MKLAFLLQQMEREVEGKRPAVIDHELALRLRRYLRFRHVFRHTYGYKLVWDELRPSVEGLPKVFEDLRAQIEVFSGETQKVFAKPAMIAKCSLQDIVPMSCRDR